MTSLAPFLARHALTPFRHREHLWRALADGTAALRELPLPLQVFPTCTELLEEARAHHAALPGAYGASLRADADAAVAALSAHAPTHRGQAWTFDLAPGFILRVVECREDRSILASTLTIHPGLTDVATWERFFA